MLGRDAEVVVTPGNPAIPGSVPTPVEELVAAGEVAGADVASLEPPRSRQPGSITRLTRIALTGADTR